MVMSTVDTVGLDVGDDVINDNASAEIDGTAIGANVGAAWVGSLAPLSPNLAKLRLYRWVSITQTINLKMTAMKLFSEETLRFKVDLKYNF